MNTNTRGEQAALWHSPHPCWRAKSESEELWEWGEWGEMWMEDGKESLVCQRIAQGTLHS